MHWNPFNWFYDAFNLDPVARSIHEEQVFESWMGLILTVAFFVLVFLGWLLSELFKYWAQQRERKQWERHCDGCTYKHRVVYVDRGGTEPRMEMWCEYWCNGYTNPLGCRHKKQ